MLLTLEDNSIMDKIKDKEKSVLFRCQFFRLSL